MSLLDDVRQVVRVVATATDAEIEADIRAALSDMKRVGIRESMLDPYSMNPLAKIAVFDYVRAKYGLDNKESGSFMASYRQTLADLLNSSANERSDEDDFTSFDEFSASLNATVGSGS